MFSWTRKINLGMSRNHRLRHRMVGNLSWRLWAFPIQMIRGCRSKVGTRSRSQIWQLDLWSNFLEEDCIIYTIIKTGIYFYTIPFTFNVEPSIKTKSPLALPFTSPIIDIIISPVGRQWDVCGVELSKLCISEDSKTYRTTTNLKLAIEVTLLFTLCSFGAFGLLSVSTMYTRSDPKAGRTSLSLFGTSQQPFVS